MEFKVGTVTVSIINPEAIPTARKRIAELAIKMAERQIEERK